MSDSGNLGEMQALSAAVDAGQLRLNTGAAERCAQMCTRYIDGLNQLKRMANSLVDKEAFGELGSAQQLGQKFFDLAVGGEGSFEQVIQGHIDVAMKMQEVFTNAGAAYRSTEDANSQSITAVGSDLQ